MGGLKNASMFLDRNYNAATGNCNLEDALSTMGIDCKSCSHHRHMFRLCLSCRRVLVCVLVSVLICMSLCVYTLYTFYAYKRTHSMHIREHILPPSGAVRGSRVQDTPTCPSDGLERAGKDGNLSGVFV